jgi:anti-anti-sigma factor
VAIGAERVHTCPTMPGRTDLTVSVVDLDDERVTLVFAGEVDEDNADVADSYLTRVTGDGAVRSEIVLDMAAVTFIDSRGLGVLLRHRRALDPGVRMVIDRPSANICRLLEITALDQVFAIRDAQTLTD